MNQEHENSNQPSSVVKTAKKWFGYTSAFVTFLASLATFLAFCFAIYAYYYSSIPEQLVSKLNSDIAVLNEEVIDMKREKRLITEQITKEQAEFETLIESQREKITQLEDTSILLEQEINNLQSEKTRLLKEKKNIEQANVTNKKYRKEYLADSVEQLFGQTFISEVSDDIRLLELHANQAREFPQWLEAVRITKQFNLEEKSTQEKINFVEVRSKQIPDTWLTILMRGGQWFRGQRNDITSEKNKSDFLVKDQLVFDDSSVHPRVAMTIDLIHKNRNNESLNDDETTEAFRFAISQTPPKVNAIDHLKSHIEKRKQIIAEMNPADREKIFKAIDDYLLKYDDFLKRPVVVIVDKTASADEVVSVGEIVHTNIKHFEKIVANMGEQLSIVLKE